MQVEQSQMSVDDQFVQAMFGGADESSQPVADEGAQDKGNDATVEGESAAQADAVENTQSQDGETQAAEDKSGDDEQAQESSPIGLSQEIEINLADGGSQKVTLEQLKDGYLRQSEYAQQVQEFKQKQQSFEQEASAIKQQTLSVLQALQQRYQQLDPVSLLSAKLQEAVADGDIELANSLRLDIQDAQRQQMAIERAIEHEEKLQADKKEQERQEFLADQRTRLLEKLPVIKTQEGSKKFQDTVGLAMSKVGLTAKDVGDMPDHRNAMLAYYAGLYLQAQDAKPQVAASLKGKSINTQQQARQTAHERTKAAAEEAFRRNPTIDNFIKLI
jgi:hypothetical protein